jgi:hypothetical protein
MHPGTLVRRQTCPWLVQSTVASIGKDKVSNTLRRYMGRPYDRKTYRHLFTHSTYAAGLLAPLMLRESQGNLKGAQQKFHASGAELLPEPPQPSREFSVPLR